MVSLKWSCIPLIALLSLAMCSAHKVKPLGFATLDGGVAGYGGSSRGIAYKVKPSIFATTDADSTSESKLGVLDDTTDNSDIAWNGRTRGVVPDFGRLGRVSAHKVKPMTFATREAGSISEPKLGPIDETTDDSNIEWSDHTLIGWRPTDGFGRSVHKVKPSTLDGTTDDSSIARNDHTLIGWRPTDGFGRSVHKVKHSTQDDTTDDSSIARSDRTLIGSRPTDGFGRIRPQGFGRIRPQG